MQGSSPKGTFAQQFASPAENAREMDPHAPILFRLIESEVKTVEFDFILILVKNPKTYVCWMTRVICAKRPPRIQIAADADAQGLFQSAFAIGDGIIKGTDATVYAEPPWSERLFLRLGWGLF